VCYQNRSVVRLYETSTDKTDKPNYFFDEHVNDVRKVSFSADGKYLAAAATDSVVGWRRRAWTRGCASGTA
jgi:hypothetical protein